MKGEILRRRNERGSLNFDFITGLLFGGILASASMSFLVAIDESQGRGSQVTACPEGYAGMVQVTDPEQALGELATVAEEFGVPDSESEAARDIADKPGELSCRQDIGGGNTISVLTISGLDALQRTETLSGDLPNGLKWTSTIRR